MTENSLSQVSPGAKPVLEPTHEDPLLGLAKKTVQKLIAKDFEDPTLDIFSYGPELKGFVAGVQQYDEEDLTNFSTVTHNDKTYGVIVTANWTTAPGRKDTIGLRVSELTSDEVTNMQHLSQISDGHRLDSEREELLLQVVQRINKGAGSMIFWNKDGSVFEHKSTQGRDVLPGYLDIINSSLQSENRTLHSFDIRKTVDENPVSKKTRSGDFEFSPTLGWQPKIPVVPTLIASEKTSQLDIDYEPLESGVRRLMIPLRLGDFQGSHIREIVVLRQREAEFQKRFVSELNESVKRIPDFSEGAKLLSSTVEQIYNRDQNEGIQAITRYLEDNEKEFHNGILIIPVGKLNSTSVTSFTLSLVENSPETTLVEYCKSRKTKLVFLFSETEYSNYFESSSEQMPGARSLRPATWIDKL